MKTKFIKLVVKNRGTYKAKFMTTEFIPGEGSYDLYVRANDIEWVCNEPGVGLTVGLRERDRPREVLNSLEELLEELKCPGD